MQDKTNQYRALEKKLQQIMHLKNLAETLYWDTEIILPLGGAPSRQQALGTFEALIHELKTSKELGDLIQAAEQEKTYLDEWQKSNLKLAKRTYEHAQCISTDLQNDLTVTTVESEFVWREARKKNDFTDVWPLLDKIFDLTRTVAQAKADHFGEHPYDMLMDSYDPGRKTVEIQPVFDTLKTELPQLIKKIIARQQTEQVIPFTEKIDQKTQKAIGLRVLEKMGFDMRRGRLDEAAHPFCRGSKDDSRLTTRYNEADFTSGFFAIMHEAGHGLYEQNKPDLHHDQPVAQAQGMAIHESQSLIMECQAGTSFEFIQFLAKLLHDDFGLRTPAYTAENLYKLITRVKPSLIRVEADEVTYPLHVILRFEIEQAIINEKLSSRDLPDLWRTKMQQYLGIVPPSDREGCLQDVHWPAGLIGYFPSYTNGAIIASMLMHAAQKHHPELRQQLTLGNFEPLNNYLNKHLRSVGALYTSSQLLRFSTGYETINPTIFLDYLTRKYLG